MKFVKRFLLKNRLLFFLGFLAVLVVVLPILVWGINKKFEPGRSSQAASTSAGISVLTEVYFTQPSIYANQVDSTIIPEIQPQYDKFLIRGSNVGPINRIALTWDVGRYTGFTSGVCPECYQRGINNISGGTAVQINGTTGGIWINTSNLLHNRGLVTITPGYWWSGRQVQPWRTPGGEIGFSFEMKVPVATKMGGAEVYVVPYMLFTDMVSGKSFWYGAQTFDLRPAFPEAVLFDPGTKAPIVARVMRTGTTFTHLGPNSSIFQQTPWNYYKYFEFRINEVEFKRALGAVRTYNPTVCPFCQNFSTDPGSYYVSHFSYNPEVFDSAGGSSGQLGLSYRDTKLVRYSVLRPTLTQRIYNKVYVRGANASSNSQMQIFFKTPTSNFYSIDKSVTVKFPTGGGLIEVIADMSTNPSWRGTITGLRVDPFNATGNFNIDYVYVGDANRNYIKKWDFNGATKVTNPFQGWTLYLITNTWTDGGLWGGIGTNDPFFFIDTDFSTGI